MRTLLIRPGAIGDCIMHFPQMEALRTAYTEVWISRSLVPIVLFADRVRALADTSLDLLGIPGIDPHQPLIDALRGFNQIHSWYGAKREDFRAALTALNPNVTFHDALPTAPPTAIPQIPIQGPRHGAIIIHPFSGSAKKNWPLANFRELAARLGHTVAWTAGPEEDLPEARHFDSLYDLAHWISGARLYIGNDSGITHLAAALGVKTVALFGPTDPAIWCPPGPHVHPIPFAPVDEVAAMIDCILCADSSD